MTLQRYLDEIEADHIEAIEKRRGRPGHFLYPTTVRYRGVIDVELLKVAIRHLSIRCPILRARVKKEEGRRYLLYVPDGSYPSLQIVDDGALFASKLRDCLEDSTDECARLILHQEESEGYLVLAMLHSFMDAAAITWYWRELWALYAKAENKASFSVDAGELPPQSASTYSSLPLNRTTNGNQSQKYSDASINGSSAPSNVMKSYPPVYKNKLIFSEHETAKLVRFCRMQHISVTAILAGAMLSLLRDQINESGPQPITMFANIDARKNTVRPLGAEDTSQCVWYARTTISIGLNDDFLAVAQKANSYFNRIRNEMPGQATWAEGAHDDLRINNGGIVFQDLVMPDGLELVDVGLSEVYTGESSGPTWIENKSIIHAYTVNKRMKITHGVRGDLDNKLVDLFEDRLRFCIQRID